MTSNIQRYRQIADVLARNGLSMMADRMGLLDLLPDTLRERVPQASRGKLGAAKSVPGPVRLRQALEELGPTFVKLGQMLSTRSDLLPVEYTQELEKLQSSAPAVDFEYIEPIVERELGAPVGALFAQFDKQPLAAASIGQAHRATLPDGTPVVVKIRKPGVSESVLADLDLLRSLAALVSREWEAARDLDVDSLIATFDRTLRGELDYLSEAANAEQFRQNLATDPAVRIPAVFTELTTSEVITEEQATGINISDTAALDAAGIDRPALARTATQTLIRMVLVDGFFHADPHPGNLFVGEDGIITLIDFGMVGRLGPTVREDLLKLLYALSHGDNPGAVSALLHLAPPRRGIDRRRLGRDVESILRELTEKSLDEISMATVAEQITSLIRRHRMQLPPDVSTLIRMLILVEAMAVTLDPDFRISTALDSVVPVAMAQLLSPQAIARHLAEAGRHAFRLGSELPGRLERILEDYEHRGVEARMHPEDLEPLVERMEDTADRVIVGMTTSALIIGIGTVVASQPGTDRLRNAMLVAAGAAAGLSGTYLVAGAGPVRKVVRMALRGMKRS